MDKYLEIDNNELKEILSYITDTSMFLEGEKRLLSKIEILNYKELFQTEKEIIPLIDLCNNDLLVYSIENNKFQIFNITDNLLYKDIDNIKDYILSIKNSIRKSPTKEEIQEHDRQVGDGSKYLDYFKRINSDKKEYSEDLENFIKDLDKEITESEN